MSEHYIYILSFWLEVQLADWTVCLLKRALREKKYFKIMIYYVKRLSENGKVDLPNYLLSPDLVG